MSFILDERLQNSSFALDEWDLCTVRLKNDRTWPWLYLVPKRRDVSEFFQLQPQDQAQLMREISFAGEALKILYSADKINTAALGNMVPQLHIHVFARFRHDPAWPKPVWAVQTDEIPYTENDRNAELEKLRAAFLKLRGDRKAI